MKTPRKTTSLRSWIAALLSPLIVTSILFALSLYGMTGSPKDPPWPAALAACLAMSLAILAPGGIAWLVQHRRGASLRACLLTGAVVGALLFDGAAGASMI